MEILDISEETWKYPTSNEIHANNSSVSIVSNEQDILKSMKMTFGNKSFLRFQCQGFDLYPLINSYSKEEEQFLKIVEVIPIDKVPENANIVNSHVIYKLKNSDDGSLSLKSRIAPHGNEDKEKENLTTDCQTCPPVGIRIVCSIASLMGWKLKRADAKGAFLKTGRAQRNVYVKPPSESKMRSTHLWLLLVAAYGLVNSGAKWQHQSDELIINMGFLQSKHIPQLFYLFVDGSLRIILAKIVDDIILTGEDDDTNAFIEHFNSIYELGSVASGPGELRFYGTNVIQLDDFTIEINAEDKMSSISQYEFSRQRRKQIEEPINYLEKNAFMSFNSTLGWIGSTVSPLCSFYSSYLQQKLPGTKVKHIIEQNSIIKKLQKQGTGIVYPRPPLNKEFQLSVVVFADASKSNENGQLGIVTGLLIGDLCEGSVLHNISWISHKSKRPVKSVPAAEILAAAEGIDEGKMISGAYSEIFNMKVDLKIFVDSKDLFTSLSTQRLSIDRSIRGDVGSIRFEFQTGAVQSVSWIPGKINMADVLTKKDSALTDMLTLCLYTGKIPIDFENKAETKSTEKILG